MKTKDLSALAALLDTYRKNRQKVPIETLKTKYKVSWDALKDKIAEEAEKEIKSTAFQGLVVFRDDWMDPDGFAEQVGKAWVVGDYSKRTGRALFRNMDLDEFRILAEAFRKDVLKIYEEYLNKRESEGKETA